MRNLYWPLLAMLSTFVQAQIVTVLPKDASANQEIEIIYNASLGTGGLKGATSVYIHTGVVLSSPTGTEWNNVVGNWGKDDGIGKMSRVEGKEDTWRIKLSPTALEYYKVPSGRTVFRLSMVFRNADGSKEGKGNPGDFAGGTVTTNGDIYLDLRTDNFVLFENPTSSETFISSRENLDVILRASSKADSIKLYNHGKVLASSRDSEKLEFTYKATDNEELLLSYKAWWSNSIKEDSLQTLVKVYQDNFKNMPPGIPIKRGVSYLDDSTRVRLVLEAPQKSFVYLLGDFNQWDLKKSSQLFRQPNSDLFWIELDSLVPGLPYVFQYWVNGVIKIGDPFTEMVVDPWNDEFIAEEVFSSIPKYTKKEYGPASVLQTLQNTYKWKFSNPDIDTDNLMVYELLVRDFVPSHSFKEVKDSLAYLKKLGVNAIEIMPVMEFEGNESWGYNPSYFFAVDKYYGTKNDFKALVDEAHHLGISVFVDVVLNHAFGQNPWVRMYWDEKNNKPAANSPFFNPDAKHPFNVGFDFNHESPHTQFVVDSFCTYLLQEFHVDGFRFDLSKGFTQKNTTDVSAWSARDEARISYLKSMGDKIWKNYPNAVLILEHFADFAEEKELREHGFLTWGNNHFDFERILSKNPNSNISSAGEKNRLSYMESHDEERLLATIQNGLEKGVYSTADTVVALERLKALKAFLLIQPGPKMLWQFQEVGYDIPINFNGRTGNKPLPWGEGGMAYYKNPQRLKLLEVTRELLHFRDEFKQLISFKNLKRTDLKNSLKQLEYTDGETGVMLLGNFDLEERNVSIFLPGNRWYYDYFQKDSLKGSTTISLAPGEFRLLSTEKVFSTKEDILEVQRPIVVFSKSEISMEDPISMTLFKNFLQTKDTISFTEYSGPIAMHFRFKNGDNVLSDSIHLGKYNTGNSAYLEDFPPIKLKQLAKDEGLDFVEQVEFYFTDPKNELKGFNYGMKPFRVRLKNTEPVVVVSPIEFDENTPITITFNALAADPAGTKGLIDASKVYMHAGIVSESSTSTAWQYVKGNWGQDDGIGRMTKMPNSQKWQISITPKQYFNNVPQGANWKRIGMVFRNADGTAEGKAAGGADIFVNFTELPDAVLSISEKEKFIVFPNPAVSEKIYVVGEDSFTHAEWYTTHGKKVFEEKCDPCKELTKPQWSNLFLILRLKGEGRKTVTRRIFLK